MGAYFLKRLFLYVPTIFLMVTISFFVIRLAPGSPFTALGRALPPEIIANLSHFYHFDLPLWQQYLYYLGDLLHGRLGLSFKQPGYSVNEVLAIGIPYSFKLGGLALLLGVSLGIFFGIIAALKHRTRLDYIMVFLATLGHTVPSFVVGPLFILFFAVWLRIFPAGGWGGGGFHNLFLPVVTMSLLFIGQVTRLMRGSMLEVLHMPHIRTAKAKGLSFKWLVIRHALKISLLPVVSYLGVTFANVLTGSMVIETVFSIPGIGSYFVKAALNRDYAVVMGTVIFYGTLVITMNLLVDLFYAVLDPRIRYRKGS